MKIIVPLIALLLTNSSLGKDACLGPDKATDAFIYLHGLDDPKVGDHENRNRQLLQKIAEDMNVKIAVPRSNEVCRHNKACWVHQNTEQIVASTQFAIKQSQTCLGTRKLKGLIGFSNGGYLLSKYFQTCKHSEAISYLIIGALGELGSAPSDLASCGHLTIGIGTKDQVYRRSKNLYQTLSKKFPERVKFAEFAGGHDLNEQVIRTWLKESMDRSSKIQK